MKNRYWVKGNIAWVELTQGQKTCVDVEDLPKLAPFSWRANRHSKGYRAYANTKDGCLFMHRFLANAQVGEEIDHKDVDMLNNRKSNFRRATRRQNCSNRKVSTQNTSGYKGVSLHKGRWRAAIKAAGKEHWLGYFPTKELAAWVYNMVAVKLHGRFARLNSVRVLSSGD